MITIMLEIPGSAEIKPDAALLLSSFTEEEQAAYRLVVAAIKRKMGEKQR